MVDTLVRLSPLLAVVIAALSPVLAYIGAALGRKRLLDHATQVLDEQAEEAIVQYKAIKALLSTMLSIIEYLHKAEIINGDGGELRQEVLNVQAMLEDDVIEKKKKTLFVRR